jgi:hypothetical protein
MSKGVTSYSKITRASEDFQGCNVRGSNRKGVSFATGEREKISGNRGAKLHGISAHHHEQTSKGISSDMVPAYHDRPLSLSPLQFVEPENRHTWPGHRNKQKAQVVKRPRSIFTPRGRVVTRHKKTRRKRRARGMSRSTQIVRRRRLARMQSREQMKNARAGMTDSFEETDSMRREDDRRKAGMKKIQRPSVVDLQ